MVKRLAVLLLAMMLGAAVGYTIGRRQPASWKVDRTALYGQVRDLRERNRQLERAVNRSRRRMTTRPTSGPGAGRQ
jgi:membrane protein DedA with SNARE-associated domain